MKLKHKTEDRTQNTEHRRQDSPAKRLTSCLCLLTSSLWVLCFVFLPLNLTASLTGIASANSATETVLQSPQNGSAISGDPNSTLARQLRQAEISAAKARKESESKKRLKQIIEQVRAVEFVSQAQPTESPITPEQTPTPEPNSTPSDVQVPEEDAEPANEPKLPYEPVAEQTLEMLRNLSQKPEKVENPLELAEILFLSGNLNDAAMLYQEALKRQDPNDAAVSRDRAWILFQSGNCLRNDDMPAAAKMYRRLQTEYPTSPWAELAKARGKLIDWYLKDEPEKLVAEVRSAKNEPE